MDVEPFSLELSEPLATARGEIETRDGFLVRVERDGVEGVGEATPLAGWTEPLEACRRALDGATVDDLPDPESTPTAAHGVGLAALDLAAKESGERLADALGGAVVDPVPVNATLGDRPGNELVAAARAAVDRGFRTLKLKVGSRSIGEDVSRVRAVREAVGDEVSIRLDANGAWTFEGATRAVDALASAGIEYVEQPLAPQQLREHGDLDGVRVAIDEGIVEHGPDAVIDAGVADAVVLKPMALGGVRRAREIAARALDASIEPVVTTTVDAVVARTAAVHLASTIPDVAACGLATGGLLAADLAPDPAPVEAGSVSVPSGPGIGVEVAGSLSAREGPGHGGDVADSDPAGDRA